MIGQHGDIEHLRSALGPGEVMRPGQVYWITDKTPHESLPLDKKTMRQFFRIVTSEVSFWFSDHSTPSPLGVTPDPRVTKTVRGDKFSEEGVEIVGDHCGGSMMIATLVTGELLHFKQALIDIFNQKQALRSSCELLRTKDSKRF